MAEVSSQPEEQVGMVAVYQAAAVWEEVATVMAKVAGSVAVAMAVGRMEGLWAVY